MATTPDVFIIESLRFKDEAREYPEGRFIAHILKLAGRKVRYFYIRTRAELEEVLDKFEDSNFRYLHLSCHADSKGMELTLDHLSISEMKQLIGPILQNRRIFLSACELATPKLATALLKETDCYSVVGPSTTIDFDEAALFWASLYHLMFREEAKVMKRKELQRNIRNVAKLFEVSIRYFAKSSSKQNGWVEVDVGG